MILDQQIAATQRRLWANRFLSNCTAAFAIAFFLFTSIWIVERLFDFHWPMMWVGVSIAAIAFVTSAIWTWTTREDALTAGACLDQAAGLRERVSTSQYCTPGQDEFADAVLADAEKAIRGIRVGRIIRLTPPSQWGWAVAAVVFAILPLLIPVGLLKPAEAKASEEKKAVVESTRVAVKHEMDQLRELVDKTPVLEDVKAKDEQLDLGGVTKEQSPADIRHEALKKIDRYEDALRQKKNSERYDSLADTRKMMRAVKPPESDEAATQKLAKALQQGDFKSAKEEVEKLQEQLATLKSDEDKEMVQKIGQQLEELSKQLEKAASEEKLAKELEDAGIKKEDIEKMLEHLSKKDLEQLQKKLEESGMSKEKAEKLAKQFEQKQGAKSMASKMAQSMKGSASEAKAGQGESAAAKLSQAGEQLGELEKLEQEMSQLDAAASAMADAKKDIEQHCSKCGGSGQLGGKPCDKCGGKGKQPGNGGMGQQPGQGRGGQAEKQESSVAFKTERQKVHTGKGAIVGQLVFEGEQIPGTASSEVTKTVAASEREASDLIHRDRVPRQYQKAVKTYFSKVNRNSKPERGPAESESKKTNEDQPADEKKD